MLPVAWPVASGDAGPASQPGRDGRPQLLHVYAARVRASAALGVDFAVSTTGVAGPDPDPVSGAKPGLFFVALAGGELGTMVREVQVEGDRAEIRSAARRAALLALYDALSMRE